MTSPFGSLHANPGGSEFRIRWSFPGAREGNRTPDLRITSAVSWNLVKLCEPLDQGIRVKLVLWKQAETWRDAGYSRDETSGAVRSCSGQLLIVSSPLKWAVVQVLIGWFWWWCYWCRWCIGC